MENVKSVVKVKFSQTANPSSQESVNRVLSMERPFSSRYFLSYSHSIYFLSFKGPALFSWKGHPFSSWVLTHLFASLKSSILASQRDVVVCFWAILVVATTKLLLTRYWFYWEKITEKSKYKGVPISLWNTCLLNWQAFEISQNNYLRKSGYER